MKELHKVEGELSITREDIDNAGIVLVIREKIKRFTRHTGLRPKYLIVSPEVMHKYIEHSKELYDKSYLTISNGDTPTIVMGLEVAILDLYSGIRVDVAR